MCDYGNLPWISRLRRPSTDDESKLPTLCSPSFFLSRAVVLSSQIIYSSFLRPVLHTPLTSHLILFISASEYLLSHLHKARFVFFRCGLQPEVFNSAPLNTFCFVIGCHIFEPSCRLDRTYASFWSEAVFNIWGTGIKLSAVRKRLSLETSSSACFVRTVGEYIRLSENGVRHHYSTIKRCIRYRILLHSVK